MALAVALGKREKCTEAALALGVKVQLLRVEDSRGSFLGGSTAL